MEQTVSEIMGTDKVVNIKQETFPLISFIMPVYKDGKTVARAIDSIFDQDWPNIEVIAVNDGSPDNTKQELEKLKKKYEHLQVINFKENRGACVARNEGAKLAKGKYYAWLPADAKLYPGAVRKWLEKLELHPDYDFLYGGYRFVNDDGTQNSNYWSDMFNPYLLECANYIDGTFPVRSEAYWRAAKLMNQSDGLWDANIKSLQDWDFWLSIVKEGKGKGIYWKEIFFETYFPHPGGLSFDSHQNWLARTRQIKLKHKIPDRKICVTSPGAPFFGAYLAKILDADFQYMPSLKQHDYDLIYELGWYPSIGDQCDLVFADPRYIELAEQLRKDGKPLILANCVKVVHLIGTDLLQMQYSNKYEIGLYKHFLNGRYDHVFTEFKETQKEAKELGLNTKILPIPPRQYFTANPFPKDFTVAVYAPKVNQALYCYDLMLEVAKKLPKIKFKFFGDVEKVGGKDNVEYCGYVGDMQKFIDSCSCLVRITQHDGLPQGVLEFLSAGRRVVFNHEFEHCAKPEITLDAVKNAIVEESKKPLNMEATKWVRKNFTKEKFKKKVYSLLQYDPKIYWKMMAPSWIHLRAKFYGTKDWEHIEYEVKKINPKSVIDVGCGEGQWSEKFDCEYLGIDFEPKMIEAASAKHPTKKFAVGSVEDFKPKKKYDLAFVYTTLLHVPESGMQKAVDSLKKMAKYAIIVEPVDIETKYYQHNHNYDKWFKITKRVRMDKRMLMVVNLSA